MLVCLPPYKHFLQSLKIQSKVWGFTVVVLALLKTYSLVWKVWQRQTPLILFKTSNIKVENRRFLQLIHTTLHILSSFYTHSFTHTHTHALYSQSYFDAHSFFLSNPYLHTLLFSYTLFLPFKHILAHTIFLSCTRTRTHTHTHHTQTHTHTHTHTHAHAVIFIFLSYAFILSYKHFFTLFLSYTGLDRFLILFIHPLFSFEPAYIPQTYL